ncbi:MAG: crossover junction endodeoxyribonuclease RuvC, partial [Clostridia bacterium]|nr:crossover junction endodeoxyribonuclease RuvC [Clostridia bacterium]
MLVLGLDPGLATTGYGLVAGDGRDMRYIAHGVFRTAANQPVAQRLMSLHDQLAELLARYRPDVAVVENLFFATNVRTAMNVGQARGVLLLTLAQAGLAIAEYTPLQIKQSVTGYGQADKIQVQQMVRILLNLAETPRPDDAADALAASICHHHSARMQTLLDEYRGKA